LPNASSRFEGWDIALTRRNRKAPAIKWSLFVSFTSMTVVIMILLWVLYFLLLNTVYSWTVKSRMQTLIYEIAYEAPRENFDEIAVSLAENADTAMAIYRVDGDVLTLYAESQEKDGVAHLFDTQDIVELYEKTVEGGSVFQERLEDALQENRFSATQKEVRLLTAFVTQAPSGVTYFILLDTAGLPLTAFFVLMQNQLSLVSLILLAIAAGISFLLARHIARPIERISTKARKMSKGELALDFTEKSYREIEELSEILNQTTDELSKIDRLQKELIANISHDLRTPLTMIVGYAEVMRDIEGENTPENIQVIIDEATRLSLLVNDLLEISRIQGDDAKRRDETFDLARLAEETVERYRRLKENSGFVFEFEARGDCHVTADKTKILQVLCNLLNNAINYSEDSRTVRVCIAARDHVVRLEVIDHGIGIAPENLDNVWQRYYRGEGNHRRSVAGSGLGLSIVREILELHGARYGVNSTLGEGSTFWFELLHESTALSPERV